MKILFVYQFLTKGGVEAVIFNRMAELTRRGVDSRALFFQDYGGSVHRFQKQVLISKDSDTIQTFTRDFQPEWALHFDTPQIIASLAAWLPGIKQVYEVHTTYPKNYRLIKTSAVLENLCGFMVPSEFQAQTVRRLLRENKKPVVVVPNGISEGFFMPQSAWVKSSYPVVAWIGRLESHKNWVMFLKIVELVSQSNPQARFWMVGGSHAIEQQQMILWQKIVDLELMDRFRWFPEIPADKIPGLLQAVSRSGGCLISTSKGESFGLAVLEAMASGCPVVVPEVGGMSELVQHGMNGYVYQPGDIQAAKKAVESILGNQPEREAMQSHAIKLAQNYTNAAVVDRMLETLTEWGR